MAASPTIQNEQRLGSNIGMLRQMLFVFATLITMLLFTASVNASQLSDEEHVSFSAVVQVAQAEGGPLQAKLVVTANVADGLHIYAQRISCNQPTRSRRSDSSRRDRGDSGGQNRPISGD